MDLDEEHPHFRHYQYFLASFDLLNYVHQPTRYGQTKLSCLDLLFWKRGEKEKEKRREREESDKSGDRTYGGSA